LLRRQSSDEEVWVKKRLGLAMGCSALVLALCAAWPAEAQAQHRSRGRVSRARVFVGASYGPYYGPFAASHWWAPYGAYGFYGPYGPYGFAPYGYRAHDEGGARLQVKPKQTRVYVDGYLAGEADDFDGIFQRLRVRPGGHEVTLFLDGHRTVRERLYFSPGSTVKLRVNMEPLPPGETAEPPRRKPAS
jgi:hypothetical protein